VEDPFFSKEKKKGANVILFKGYAEIQRKKETKIKKGENSDQGRESLFFRIAGRNTSLRDIGERGLPHSSIKDPPHLTEVRSKSPYF